VTRFLKLSCLIIFVFAVVWGAVRLYHRKPAETGSATLPSTSVGAAIHVDSAPRLGEITIGAFAPESVPNDNLSIESLDSDEAYDTYRQAVRSIYGADLADMNYLGVGVPGWQTRYGSLERWLSRASKYGDPTIAIEPIGQDGYDVFQPGPEMDALRQVFADMASAGVIVWVRFASESNLRYSVYSVYNDPLKIAQYRKSVRWFRSYMPGNVRLVFSPLINTAYLQDPRQVRTLIAMYEPGAYDRIGGTLYATSWLRPKVAFDWYYQFMRRLDRKTPFQICELGSIYPRSEEVRAFLIRVAKGDWPGVQRVNLFAGDLNPLAVNQHGHFGFILPGESSSYLSDLLSSSGTGATVIQASDNQQLTHLEELGAGWRSPDMTLVGTVLTKPNPVGDFTVSVTEVTDDLGITTSLSPPRKKQIVLTDDCTGAELLSSMSPGTTLQITGWDSGAGTPLRATGLSPGLG
jgi:hypothetical protein